MAKITQLFVNFRVRKRILALADAFIVVVAGLFSNFFLFSSIDRISKTDLLAMFFLSVLMCFGSLLFFGAYNKLWRYLNRSDYLSCVKGVVVGIIATQAFFFIAKMFFFVYYSLTDVSLNIVNISLKCIIVRFA